MYFKTHQRSRVAIISLNPHYLQGCSLRNLSPRSNMSLKSWNDFTFRFLVLNLFLIRSMSDFPYTIYVAFLVTSLAFLVTSSTQSLPVRYAKTRAHTACKDLLTSQRTPLERLSKLNDVLDSIISRSRVENRLSCTQNSPTPRHSETSH